MTTALEGVRISVDARYLARRGVGITVYLEHAIRQLIEAGASLTLLTRGVPGAPELHRRYPEAESAALHARTGFGWEQLTLARHLRAARPDVHLAPGNLGLPLLHPGETRLVLVVHDLIPWQMPGVYLRGRPVWAAQWLTSMAIALLRADVVITPSEASADAVRKLVRRKKLRVAYPPLPAPVGEPHTDTAVPRLPGRYLVYLGGYDPRKNVEALVRSFAMLRSNGGEEVGLALLGDVSDEVLDLVHQLGPDSGIHVLGYVDDDTKLSLVQRAAAVVHPSSMEGFGIPLVEAFACGVPVLSGVGGALREVGGEAPLYVDPIDDRSIQAGLEAVLDPSERVPRIELGRQRLATLRSEVPERSVPKAVAAALGRI